MKPLIAIFSARFRLLLHYRAAAFAGLTTQIAWGFLISMGLAAYYRGTDQPPPLPLEQLVSYVWLGQAMFSLLPWNGDAEIRALVRNGNVAYELLRPVDLYAFWFARALAWRTAPTLLRSVPLALLALAFFGLRPPASVEAGAAFVAAMVGALALSASITVLVNTTLFWTISGEGVVQALPIIVGFFSGMILPLPLFPSWAQPLLTALPFRGIVDAPYRLYTGNMPVAELGTVLLLQWIWVAILVCAGRWFLQRALRRVVVQGG